MDKNRENATKLSDEELDSVSGGQVNFENPPQQLSSVTCHSCGKRFIIYTPMDRAKYQRHVDGCNGS